MPWLMGFKHTIAFSRWKSFFSPLPSRPCHRSRSSSWALSRFMTVLVAADVKLWALWVFIRSNQKPQAFLNSCSQRKRRGWSDKADERHSLAGSVFTLTVHESHGSRVKRYVHTIMSGNPNLSAAPNARPLYCGC